MIKREWLKIVGFFFSLMLLHQFSWGQETLFTQYKFQRLNEAHGLNNNVINDIIQDTLGQIWVGTEEGLFRYQGFDFQRFIKDKNNPNSLHISWN